MATKDAIMFLAAAPADGRTYVCEDGEEFKYKKEAVAYSEGVGIDVSSIDLEYRPEPDSHAIHNTKLLLERIFNDVEYDDYIIFLQGNKQNYRKDIDPEYKAHREGVRKPHHLETVYNWLVKNTSHALVDDQEVDDALGIAQSALEEPTCIVTHDKDLDQVPGPHYRLKKGGANEYYEVGEEDATTFFYQQLLTGDRTDNIFGLPRVGDKTAQKILMGLETEEEMYEVVRDKYEEYDMTDKLLTNANLLWIRREPNTNWSPPNDRS